MVAALWRSYGSLRLGQGLSGAFIISFPIVTVVSVGAGVPAVKHKRTEGMLFVGNCSRCLRMSCDDVFGSCIVHQPGIMLIIGSMLEAEHTEFRLQLVLQEGAICLLLAASAAVLAHYA